MRASVMAAEGSAARAATGRRRGHVALGIGAATLAAVAAAAGIVRRSPGVAAPAATEPPRAAAMPSSPAPGPALPPSATPPPAGYPAPGAAAAEIRVYLEAHPGHADRAALRARHDAALLPCAAESLTSEACVPETLPLLEGALARADAYVARCYDCRHRKSVGALARRLRAAVKRARAEKARERFEWAMTAGDLDEAEQVVDDSGAWLGDAWLARARKRLEKRRPAGSGEACRLPPGMGVIVSPASAVPGDRVRALFASEHPLDGAEVSIEARAADGGWQALGASGLRAGGGPPWFFAGESEVGAHGSHRVVLRRGDAVAGCRRFTVLSERRRRRPSELAWDSVRGWDREHENLFSAWISVLLDAPEAKHWPTLAAVTRERERNLLHDHLSFGEDAESGAGSVAMKPDCADAPYFLRAYFAWKLGLPFGRHLCKFGGMTGPPRCARWEANDKPWSDGESGEAGARPEDAVARAPGEAEEPPASGYVSLARIGGLDRHPPLAFEEFLDQLRNDIQAKSLRTAHDDDATDLYPVPLSRDALRPGIVFSDPYGHTLTLVKWRPQGADKPGRLLAADAQPDGTVSIKRFWRGTFLFSSKNAIGGYGFKAFRPIVLDDGEPRLLTNAEISLAQDFAPFSAAQASLDSAAFYAAMDRLINPRPLDPARAYRELHEALHKQLTLRVREVGAADEWHAKHPNRVIPMPSGRLMFNTTGPWEALSTPCRDMRLLVAVDSLREFPAQARAAGAGADAVAELERLHGEWIRELSVRYRRSDGSEHVLSLGDVLSRQQSFEMGYNPNDCAEHRWGAPEGSDERSPCSRTAPADQREKMQKVRHWFEQRYSCG
jgi:hypothetical protein